MCDPKNRKLWIAGKKTDRNILAMRLLTKALASPSQLSKSWRRSKSKFWGLTIQILFLMEPNEFRIPKVGAYSWTQLSTSQLFWPDGAGPNPLKHILLSKISVCTFTWSRRIFATSETHDYGQSLAVHENDRDHWYLRAAGPSLCG